MRQYILPLFLLLLLILALSLTVVFISRRTSFLGRATSPEAGGRISAENSYLFASPLSASATGKEKIRVTVFVLDSQGRGVYGQPVFLGEDERLTVSPIQAATDSLGRALFDVASDQPGEYFLEARVGTRVLPQRVRVVFR